MELLGRLLGRADEKLDGRAGLTGDGMVFSSYLKVLDAPILFFWWPGADVRRRTVSCPPKGVLSLLGELQSCRVVSCAAYC